MLGWCGCDLCVCFVCGMFRVCLDDGVECFVFFVCVNWCFELVSYWLLVELVLFVVVCCLYWDFCSYGVFDWFVYLGGVGL